MKRRTKILVTAAAVAAAGPAVAQASTAEPAVPVAASYSDLLQPIPNAVERLRAADAEAAQRPAKLIEAQYWYHHHHHHHHHGYYRRY